MWKKPLCHRILAIGLVFVVNGSGGEIALLHAQALQVAAAAIQLGAQADALVF